MKMGKDQSALNQRIGRYALGAGIAVFIVGIVLLACVPPVSRDALTHHLYVPKLYLEQGGIHEIPDCEFSYYPMNLDLLYMIPLVMGNDILPKYIHFAFALATALLIFFYLRGRVGSTYGLLGVLLFISIPVILKLSITVYVDLGLIFFTTAALLYFIRWTESEFRTRYLVFSAICCGLALGTKYNGLITFFLLSMFTPFAYSVKNRHSKKVSATTALYGALFVLIALSVFSPWMARNVIWKGNPLYPMFDSLFEKEAGMPVEKGEQTIADKPSISLDHFSFRKYAYGETPRDIALIPIRVFFQGQDDNPKYFDGVLNPYLLIFPLVWLCLTLKAAGRNKDSNFYLLAFAVFYLLFVFFRIDMRIRWIAPVIPPLVILTVFGIRSSLMILNNYFKGNRLQTGSVAVVLAVGAMLSLNMVYLVDQFDRVAPLDYLNGKVSRADYISRFRADFKLHEYTSRNLPNNATILGLFLGKRGYYSQRKIIFKAPLIKDLVARHAQPQEVAKALQTMGITHLMFKRDLLERWVTDNFNLTETKTLEMVFNDHLTLLYGYRGYFLYELI